MTAESTSLQDYALVVVDVQQGFDDREWWGKPNNPECEANVASLVDHWGAHGWPIILVRHNSTNPRSPLHPDASGNNLKPFLEDLVPALTIDKTVNSSFHGTPDLHDWLIRNYVPGIVVCGITTNHCCETTARVGGNLGHDVWFVVDATRTFDRRAPDGSVVSAADLVRVTATNLHGEFATVANTADIVGVGR